VSRWGTSGLEEGDSGLRQSGTHPSASAYGWGTRLQGLHGIRVSYLSSVYLMIRYVCRPRHGIVRNEIFSLGKER